jgi:hypothetical protein
VNCYTQLYKFLENEHTFKKDINDTLSQIIENNKTKIELENKRRTIGMAKYKT